MESAAALPIAPTHRTAWRRGWVRRPAWDAFFMLSGLWLAPVVLVLAHGATRPQATFVEPIYIVLTATFWIGHRVGSAYLAYCTAAYRPLLRSQRVRFVWAPLAIAVAVFAFLVPGEDVWGSPRATRIMWLVIVDYALITYHFASQHYGVLSLYRVRAGQPRSAAAKRLDRAFALVIGGLVVFVAELMAGAVFFQAVWIDPWLDPAWLAGAHGDLQRLGTLLVVLATLAMLALEVRGPRPSLPRALYLLSVSLVVLAAFWLHPFLFIVLWTVQHWTAAMGLTTVVARADPDPGPSRWYRFWHRVSRRPWLLLVVLAAVSTLLLPVMEVEATDEGESYAARALPDLMAWLTGPGIAPVLIALGFVTAFLHYQLDRAVFRLSDPQVRRAASGLLDS